MKHIKRFLLIFLAAMLLILPACDTGGAGGTGGENSGGAGTGDETPDKPDGPETPDKPDDPTPPPEGAVSVKIGAYDAEKGTVTVSAPANGKYYEETEAVTVTATPKNGYEPAAIYVNGVVAARISETYTLFLTEDITVSALFYASTASLPEVTFTTSAKSFSTAFLGYWVSETGEKLFIGEKKLSYHGTAVTSVTPRNSGDEQSYNFTVGGREYSLGWARTDYTVGYVLDRLDISSGEREFFLPDPLPAETAEISSQYIGDWTAEEGEETHTLSVLADKIAYDGAEVPFIDGGYYATTNDIFATPIGANIYFFLLGGKMHILMWNGDLNFPVVDDLLFNGGGDEEPYTVPESLRGTWKDASGKTAVLTENGFTLDGKTIAVRGSDAALLFTSEGKDYEATLYAGSNIVLQFTSYTYGADGLVSGVSHEYYFKDGRPAVTLDLALEGTWKGANGTDGTVTVTNGQIDWNGKAVTVIEAGEAREDGFVYFVSAEGKVYELSLTSTDGSDEPPVLLTLSGDDGTFCFAK